MTKLGSLTITISMLAFGQSAEAQRGGGMQRGGRGGGGFGGGLSSGSSGRQFNSGARSGSYTTQRGGSGSYGAAGEGATGPGGASAGRGAYDVSGTTANGRSYSDAGRAGGVEGPGGNAAGYRSNGYAASGANGAVAGGSRTGGVSGAGGYGDRGYGAAGYGAAGYGARGNGYGAAGYGYGTSYMTADALAAQGAAIRAPYVGSYYASPAWYGTQPGAWAMPAGGVTGTSGTPAWSDVASNCGYPQQPSYNDYGGNVVSQQGTMYVNGDAAGTPQQYAQQAGQIASAGAAPTNANDTWMPLGVFAMAQGQDSPPSGLFQLNINKQGIIRGNFHDTQTNKTQRINGSVDSGTQLAAWTIDQQKAPVYEAGIANLTKDQTTMLIHDSSGRSSQATLVRLPPPTSGDPPQGAPPAAPQ